MLHIVIMEHVPEAIVASIRHVLMGTVERIVRVEIMDTITLMGVE